MTELDRGWKPPISENQPTQGQALTLLSPLPQKDTPRRRLREPRFYPEGTPLSEKERTFLYLAASGMRRPIIGEELQISIAGVDKIGTYANQKLGSFSTINAILTALDQGILDPARIVDTFPRENLANLRPEQRELLDAAIENNGRLCTNENLARRLGISESGLEKRFLRIRKILETHTKEHTISVYAASKKLPDHDTFSASEIKLTPRRIELINLLAQGYTDNQIAEILDISPNGVRGVLQDIYRLLDVQSGTEAVVLGLDHGVIDATRVLSDVNLNVFTNLSPIDKALLDGLITLTNNQPTNGYLAEVSPAEDVTEVRYVLERLQRRLNTRNRVHTAAAYVAHKKLQATVR